MRSPYLLVALALGTLYACGGSGGDGTSPPGPDGGDDGSTLPRDDGGSSDATIDTTPPPVPSPFGLDTRPANPTCVAPARPVQNTGVALTRMWPNITFNAPIYMAQAPGDAAHWYVVERGGTVKLLATTATTNADVKTVVTIPVNASVEGGLLGMAFHPSWQTNHEMYLSYTRDDRAGDPAPPSSCGVPNAFFTSAIARFKSNDAGQTYAPNPDEILTVGKPFGNHNGGNIQFSPIDGMLYASFGDGGSGGDPCGDGQALGVKLGKILRIDVNAPAGKYNVPPDNPFVATAGADGAIWSYGHRNPWRYSFDKSTGDLWVGDVGQDTYEEVDHVQKGGNYGWNTCEGFQKYGSAAACATPGNSDPVIDYKHGNDGNCVIGGYIYRGAAAGLAGLVGTYVFGDNGSGNIWSLTYDATNKAVKTVIANAPGGQLVSFAQGSDGEVYTIRQDGQIHILTPQGTPPPDTFPQLLSQTGCVDPKDATKPASGVLPYDVISPLWSDGAQKDRFFAIPDGKTITIGADGDWDLPIGSVAMKDFAVEGKRVETRLFMRHSDGGWAGYTYEWNDQGTDAALLPAGKVKVVGTGTQVWSYPSRTQCIQCHSAAAGGTIGLETQQLNRDAVYPSTNRLSNELATLDHIGMFAKPLGAAPSTLPALPDPAGTAAIDARARSYLHSNCSHCHRPTGGGQGTMDLRFSMAFKDTVTCNAVNTQGLVGTATKLLVPGSPTTSILSLRVHATDAKRMPPVAVSIVDPLGSKVIDDWITGVTACP
jgi:uncharacterized repeat protein (TIGR03806 family)